MDVENELFYRAIGSHLSTPKVPKNNASIGTVAEVGMGQSVALNVVTLVAGQTLSCSRVYLVSDTFEEQNPVTFFL